MSSQSLATSGTSLVPVFLGQIGGTPAYVCDGRDLHAFLENGDLFANWIKSRIEKYSFEEHQDFVLVLENPKIKKGRGGDRRSKDYHLSLDMAKELSMVENNEKGRQVRRYFIEMEKKALADARQPALASEPTSLLLSEQQTLSEIIHAKAHTAPDDLFRKAVSEIWSRFKNKFRVPRYADLPRDQLTDAILYVNAMELRCVKRIGTEAPPKPDIDPYQFPLDFWQPGNRKGSTGWLTWDELTRVEPMNRPLSGLLARLTRDGHDVEGARAEYLAMRLLLESMHWTIADIATRVNAMASRGLNIAF